jgi:hypothetical protein
LICYCNGYYSIHVHRWSCAAITLSFLSHICAYELEVNDWNSRTFPTMQCSGLTTNIGHHEHSHCTSTVFCYTYSMLILNITTQNNCMAVIGRNLKLLRKRLRLLHYSDSYFRQLSLIISQNEIQLLIVCLLYSIDSSGKSQVCQ